MRRVPQGTGHVIGEATFDADALASLQEELSFESYSASFKLARSLGRKVTISVGPPNSGKTYECFQKLAACGSGAYLAPLRLLAVEARDTLLSLGVRANLLTGEDFESVEGAALTCSTIEMLDQSQTVDVMVIDEAQQLYDPSRGWAWTQAILAAPARELHIICAAHALDTVTKLLEVTGEAYTVVTYERKGELEVLPEPLEVSDLQAGDAIVSFSRMEASCGGWALVFFSRGALSIPPSLPSTPLTNPPPLPLPPSHTRCAALPYPAGARVPRQNPGRDGAVRGGRVRLPAL